jgi:hypothetical protein
MTEYPKQDDPRWVEHDGTDTLSVGPGGWVKTREGKIYLVGNCNVQFGECGYCRLGEDEWTLMDRQHRTDIVAFIPSELDYWV